MELESVNSFSAAIWLPKKKNKKTKKKQEYLHWETAEQAYFWTFKQRMHHIISITKSMSCNCGHVISTETERFSIKISRNVRPRNVNGTLRYDAIQCRWYFSRVCPVFIGRSTTKNMRKSMRLACFSPLSSIHTNLIRCSVAERLKRWTQCNPEAPSSSPTLTASCICCW